MTRLTRYAAGHYPDEPGGQPVKLVPRGANLFAGTLAATTSAQAVGSEPCKEVLVQADPANANNVLIGSSGAQPIVLRPGDSITLDVVDVALVYARMASGTGNVNWLALV